MKREIICGIYKITSPTNKIYIGKSIDVLHRFATYRRLCCKSQGHLYNSFLKHGVDQHAFEIIHVCERHRLDQLEKHYVDLYQSFNSKHGLNLRDGGGSATKMSEASKDKMRIATSAKVGSLNNFYGRTHSEETRNHWSTIRKGRSVAPEIVAKTKATKQLNPKKFTSEERDAMSRNFKCVWSNPELRRKRSEGKMGTKNPAYKGPIQQIDIATGVILKIWDTRMDACRVLNLKSASSIWKCCVGRQDTAYGFVWRYAN